MSEEKDNIIIRLATLLDLQDIHRLEQECFAIPWSLQSLKTDLTENNKVATYLVAGDHGRIAGYIGMWQVLDEAQITNLAVALDYRGRGIGSSLVRGLCLLAKEKGIARLTLEVRPSNTPARRVYESAGFAEISKRKAYYEDNGEDAIIMLKNISAIAE
jgi:ribosomal-protein-alanine N-acetyltransferase